MTQTPFAQRPPQHWNESKHPEPVGTQPSKQTPFEQLNEQHCSGDEHEKLAGRQPVPPQMPKSQRPAQHSLGDTQEEPSLRHWLVHTPPLQTPEQHWSLTPQNVPSGRHSPPPQIPPLQNAEQQ